MNKVEEKRRLVLRQIRDVHGDRLYASMGRSRSVRVEVEWLKRQNFIEEEQKEVGGGWRRTEAGDAFLTAAA